ncbi:uncharacterized protein STEHIDRAFT_144464 [Stereum hirsutum FP-91666 SS1]|uniref:uncharacterized protein n=1 Tax=Stereum hirsutum (strain FP-91666) TaxID=721885 RepID=UPI0004409FE3|nr:uncharacterized protein STEHIDRAFT_144464 [Stereum hirsutum FP-91666 SS1]EIM91004.1 hypothetical protein STEHIDRAFT_144464 [Stereum hirsutum FP-91666 SS1]
MPPRRQPARNAQATVHFVGDDVVAKRTKRHLDELERSNYTEPSSSSYPGLADDDDEPAAKSAKGRARQVISDKRLQALPGPKRKKSTMNVRSAVLYPKSLATLIEQSGIAHLPPSVPTYLTATAAPPKVPPRALCSVCGYWGRYKCMKCAMSYCDLNCQTTHDETRCERRVL